MMDKDPTTGRFQKGNRASPGRAPRRREADYLTATIDAVPVAEWRVVIVKALEDAKLGDRYARQFLADYVLGKPPQILQLQGDEARILANLLDVMKARGIPASRLFAEMMQEIANDDRDGETD